MPPDVWTWPIQTNTGHQQSIKRSFHTPGASSSSCWRKEPFRIVWQAMWPWTLPWNPSTTFVLVSSHCSSGSKTNSRSSWNPRNARKMAEIQMEGQERGLDGLLEVPCEEMLHGRGLGTSQSTKGIILMETSGGWECNTNQDKGREAVTGGGVGREECCSSCFLWYEADSWLITAIKAGEGSGDAAGHRGAGVSEWMLRPQARVH